MPSIRHRRGTRAQIDAAAGANSLKQGEVYLITDEDRLTVGTSVAAHVPMAKQSEIGGGGGNIDGGNASSIAAMNIDGGTATL